ncbi:LPS assembly outer membrane protein LptD (organic solvent tolerance protein OstA) [Neorhodopirellula lusitana]|uniref:LPS assembly outer membrane protein LptD (Organic solvent tolerance protein OstA) n=2 Tax=Neorhodopirellula lusitana TaxID=445327 RepID=A0ABY1PWU1_9BACT|nr:LPS assembly outer membrane protein LptD (organic solvent tolerance protein OstA) [Neorhodopirellula lusitana]
MVVAASGCSPVVAGDAIVANSGAKTVDHESIFVAGNTVYRWRNSQGGQDCTLVRGDCVLKHEGKRFLAEQVFLVVDGQGDTVGVHLLMDRVRVGESQSTHNPIVAHLQLDQPPRIEAQNYRGETEVPIAWWSKLNLAGPTSVANASQSNAAAQQSVMATPMRLPDPGAVMPVQYVESPGTLPQGGRVLDAPYFEAPESEAMPFAPPVTGYSPQGTPQGGIPSYSNSQSSNSPYTNSQYSGSPYSSSQFPSSPSPNPMPLGGPPPVMPLPDAPILTEDGGTTGGWQFLVGGGSRSVELLSRGASQPAQFETINRVESNETIVIARGGVTVLVRDITVQAPDGITFDLGTVSVSADRIVAWLPTLGDILTGAADASNAEGEMYLEGDIVFRQGDRIIYAESMYYNVTREVGVVLDAEAITSIPEYQGTVRVKAEQMRQIARDNYVATNAAVTSSRMGVPRYWLQSQQLQLTQRPVAKLDPFTGQAVADTEPYVSSGGNFVYMAGVPVLYWPRFTTPLRKPTFYLTGADVKSDSIFGTQVLLEWDLFQLLGLANTPDGVESILLTDYLSDRGPAIGSRTTYDMPSLFGFSGPVKGEYDSYLIDDSGLDVLGSGRRDLQPEETLRGRTTLRHRHHLSSDWEFIAELGYLSDRNFLEQYFEQDWDSDPDATTGLRLRRYAGSQLFDLNFNIQINDFYQETENLPSLNHHALGGSLLGDRLTWSMKNEVGYARLNPADTPDDPVIAAVTAVLPGEVEREGIVAGTRQEISMPLQAGPVKVVPFAIGEASHYGEDISGQDLTRLWGGGGIRANLPLSRFDQTIQSSLLNVRGLAHKIDLSAEYFYADSDTNYEQLPYYDPLDDNAQEEFRRFFTFDTFGGLLPDQYDPRNYALRQGIQRFVTSPSSTIADDTQQLRLGMKHRFQTKRGLPGRERIVDLFRFDMETILYPDEARDNFGESLGPTIFDAQYNLGDRVTLLSDGYLDFFDDGLRSLSAGIRTSRPGLGDFYVGLLSLEGPISSTVLRTSLDHRLNEKWIVSAGNTYDFGEAGNVGQSFGLTRIGESFLVQIGAKVDSGRDNTSFGFMVEPRFLSLGKLGSLGGQMIAPPGVEGIE